MSVRNADPELSGSLASCQFRVKLITHAEPAAGFRGSAARRGAVRSGAPPAPPGRIHRTEQTEREPRHRHRGGEVAWRGHGPRAALRAARAGEDYTGGDHRRRVAGGDYDYIGAGVEKKL